MAKPAKKKPTKAVAKPTVSSGKKAKPAAPAKKAGKAKPAAAKPSKPAAAKPAKYAKAPKPAPVKAKKPAAPVKAKTKGKAKPALAKPAPAKPAAKVLVKKKAEAPAKADKTVSIRVTRGKAPAKTTSRRVVPREIPMIQPVFPAKNPHSKVFIQISHQRLLHLKDEMVDSMTGMASETLRSRAQDSEASAFGMHQADAGSDAYDRDFTLSLLSQEQDALYEIEEALKRVTKGTYGICELSGKTIPVERLEVRPYARYTVDMQEIVDKEHGPNSLRRGIRSLFGLGTDDEDEDGDEDSVEEEKN